MAENIWVDEYQQVEKDDGTRYISSEIEAYETFTSDKRKLFDAYQRENGPCCSSIYRDMPDGTVQRIGWVFEKRVKSPYDNEVVTVSTWVTLLTPTPQKVQVTKLMHIPTGI